MSDNRPNILYLMCDQFRYDCIRALGNTGIHTPNLDRLARRGVVFERAYSTCPVCIPARWTLRTGRETWNTGCYANEPPVPMDGLPEDMTQRCGAYLAQVLKSAGYHTFGYGKFHAHPYFKPELGYDDHRVCEELWETPERREQDSYASWLKREHPEYNHLEQPHGDRTNMYYMPQTSALPADCVVEGYLADCTVERLASLPENEPWFGFVSFLGPHPPCAPPVPFNRMYDPDKLPNPVRGDAEVDHMDEQIPWMNRIIWADELNDFSARNFRSRYYGEITYIDGCIGRILDAVETRPDADNTLICFFADHGEHLGDHHAWQKESWFEASCHIPFLISWPARLAPGRTDALACLTDLFGLATSAAGIPELRDGVDLLGALEGSAAPRETLTAVYGRPGTPLFKIMLRTGDWKYIYMANGRGEQLFCTGQDPQELHLCNAEQPELLARLRAQATAFCDRPGLYAALENGALRGFDYTERPRPRIHQFDRSSGVVDFGPTPDPAD